MRNICFINFMGSSGGANYEYSLLSIIKYNAKKVSHLQVDRVGGWRTIFNVFSIIKKFYKSFYKSDLIRVFGMPIYKNNMIIIFHHYDLIDSPWYSKIIETVDFFLIRVLSKKLNIRFVCVSKFWKDYLENLNLNVFVIIYNDIKINFNTNNALSKKALANKYNLDGKKEWIFFGAYQKKKGGDKVVKGINSDLSRRYQFVFTGKDNNQNVFWFDTEDYYCFLSNCSLVVANSQFLEGWCRVVHEAVVLNVPVIGSGLGGMGEIFEIIGDRGRNSIECISIINKGIFNSNSANKERLLTFIQKENKISVKKLINYISN